MTFRAVGLKLPKHKRHCRGSLVLADLGVAKGEGRNGGDTED
jgi:hypothetical protein